ncbi:MAG: 1-acyl-sn-glycerol-3-phosphate acyltransferase [Gemmatimonadaceae bacterium]|nr:1-acyl-sn-glycerol-3-phosphate acyltransferase [Gemmatimonadaceae bacterium]
MSASRDELPRRRDVPPHDRPLVDAPLPAVVRASLAPLERAHLEVALRMNREPLKGAWSWCQRAIGATWIALATGRLLRVQGLEHVRDAYPRGALLFVANHRTYFDLFIVSALLHRELRGRKRLYFPVVGQYYYQSWAGMALNQLVAFWSMFPPLFALPSHGASDRYALDVLVDLCARGQGNILGIHPEGGRNLDPDPYSFMRFQPGAGKIIHAARPIVIPTFIAGLTNDLPEQLRRNWTGGEPIRVWFDQPVALDQLLALPGKGSTYKQITDTVMERVRALAECDRAQYRA